MEKSSIIIREATIVDAEQILTHTRTVLEENPQFMATTLEEFTTNAAEERRWIAMHQHTGLLLVAELDQQVIGILSFQRSSRIRYKHQGIFGISIQEKYTNGGVGSSLLTKLFQWAAENPSLEKISLEVFSNNNRAIHLYKKFGFIEEGRKIKHAKLGPNQYVDVITMGKFFEGKVF
ncbi:GNAT family N-acetyltransferase [Caldibacillus lycopersici]|uniref:GNAT family N-acetyltransferase n=1 Tax=Perspicuibacillus lycopersici TaxID=1325689 RepID=A0AAE3LRL6_9BACI|nr:GNAT family protein [Perspicuibacillus lycopersici]MCU9614799.1 GNAT family N-acetyltransferase [Perspicuibacillus lycopersici]